MSQTLDFQVLQTLYTDARFDAMARALDRLHDAASDGRVGEVSPLEKTDMVDWLKEIAFLAQQTIYELEGGDMDNKPEHGIQQEPIEMLKQPVSLRVLPRESERKAANAGSNH